MPDAFSAFIVDDDRGMRESLAHLLESAGWSVDVFCDAAHALARLDSVMPDAILSDVRMPGMSGLDLLDALSDRQTPPLVLISAHGDIPMAVDAIQRGAYSFLEKPFEPRRLLTVMDHAAETHRLTDLTRRMRVELLSLSGLDRVLLGTDLRIVALRDDVIDLALADGTVLVDGETGTGKEIVARALHRLGLRRDKHFVAVNCATLSVEGFEEQIFGCADGALGLFRKADGGTLFLDEIGACPLHVQPKLLRAIETGEIRPLGTDTEVTCDVRVVAATNVDLEAEVAQGAFRQDLLYRLNTFQLHLPPLRDRGEDVVLLFGHFVGSLAETYEIKPPEMTAEDAAALMAHSWPGNVRELRHVAERRVLAARRGGGSVAEALRRDDLRDDVPATLREAVARFERTLIAQAIRTHGGRMDSVAEALGIGRRTLNEKIVKLGLDKAEILD